LALRRRYAMKTMGKIAHKIINNPSLNIALLEPEIPANTGNVARLCGAAEICLHLIHPLGFRLDDRHLIRAGLDYWHEIDVRQHESFEAFLDHDEDVESRLIVFSSHAVLDYTKAPVRRGGYLLFGKESVGLPEDIKKVYPCYKVPIWGKVRSLNLSTAVGIVTYHCLHQLGLF
jgi:tRNA (cytidine/uridine-2'-O-)-methyltransferase